MLASCYWKITILQFLFKCISMHRCLLLFVDWVKQIWHGCSKSLQCIAYADLPYWCHQATLKRGGWGGRLSSPSSPLMSFVWWKQHGGQSLARTLIYASTVTLRSRGYFCMEMPNSITTTFLVPIKPWGLKLFSYAVWSQQCSLYRYKDNKKPFLST